MSHQAKKRFGQNFLKDQGTISKIIRSISPREDDNMIEIGPGLGAITKPLLTTLHHLNAIEIDLDVIDDLNALPDANTRLTIHQGDALKFDLATLPTAKPQRLVGNLPYNISTPLIFHILKYKQHVQDMHFMLQKEVVDRLCADFGSKTYGRLSVMAQYHCKVERLFNISAAAFVPRPKVASSFVRLIPTDREISAADESFFAVMVRDAFNQRRKTLRNSLKLYLKNVEESDLPIDVGRRAESLSVEEFVLLANTITSAS